MNVARIALAAATLMLAACGGNKPEVQAQKTPPPEPVAEVEPEPELIPPPEPAPPVVVAEVVEACDAEATVLFPFDQSTLGPDDTAALQAAAECLRKRDGTVRVAGHADPRGTEEYNLALGDRRARAVAQYLELMGVDPERTRIVSYGESLAQGTDPASWRFDRRAVVESQPTAARASR
ncbi:MAG: OmpA family protein [Myxococcales bacterium]|nr:OmpA family protein [Myxococcales bacterium]